MYRSLFIASVNHTVGVVQHSQLVAEAKLRAKLSSGSLRDKQWWSKRAVEALGNLAHWGTKRKVKFEPAKSQRMAVSRRDPPQSQPLQFDGATVPEAGHLKLLGVTFDHTIHFGAHVRTLSLCATSCLGLLRKASQLLNCRGRLSVYKGFVRPILEYAPLAWMSAAPSHHKHLNRVQRQALGPIGHGTQSLSLRHEVVALCYLYKLRYHTGPQQLRDMIPQLQHPISTHGYDTNNTPGTNFNSTTPCLALHHITCSGLSHFASW